MERIITRKSRPVWVTSNTRTWMGNGYIDSKDREVIATPQPKFFGGFFNSVNYKNFNLSFVFQFSQGAKAAVYNMMSDMYGYIGNNIYPELYGKT